MSKKSGVISIVLATITTSLVGIVGGGLWWMSKADNPNKDKDSLTKIDEETNSTEDYFSGTITESEPKDTKNLVDKILKEEKDTSKKVAQAGIKDIRNTNEAEDNWNTILAGNNNLNTILANNSNKENEDVLPNAPKTPDKPAEIENPKEDKPKEDKPNKPNIPNPPIEDTEWIDDGTSNGDIDEGISVGDQGSVEELPPINNGGDNGNGGNTGNNEGNGGITTPEYKDDSKADKLLSEFKVILDNLKISKSDREAKSKFSSEVKSLEGIKKELDKLKDLSDKNTLSKQHTKLIELEDLYNNGNHNSENEEIKEIISQYIEEFNVSHIEYNTEYLPLVKTTEKYSGIYTNIKTAEGNVNKIVDRQKEDLKKLTEISTALNNLRDLSPNKQSEVARKQNEAQLRITDTGNYIKEITSVVLESRTYDSKESYEKKRNNYMTVFTKGKENHDNLSLAPKNAENELQLIPQKDKDNFKNNSYIESKLVKSYLEDTNYIVTSILEGTEESIADTYTVKGYKGDKETLTLYGNLEFKETYEFVSATLNGDTKGLDFSKVEEGKLIVDFNGKLQDLVLVYKLINPVGEPEEVPETYTEGSENEGDSVKETEGKTTVIGNIEITQPDKKSTAIEIEKPK